ncbi:MAG TPA: hypothetical protein VEA17_05970 [Bordetella sp.]|nr:hypothetical protein [Bordetella sp.]
MSGHGTCALSAPFHCYKDRRMKIFLWIIAIIFIVGLLTVTGVLKLIF